MRILGISAFYHDSAAALVRGWPHRGGRARGALHAQQARRLVSAPRRRVLLGEAGVRFARWIYVVFYDKPFLKFERLIETYLAFAPRGFRSLPHGHAGVDQARSCSSDRCSMSELRKLARAWNERLLFTEHHLSHAASAFFPSPFEEAAVLTMDGVGEWPTTSFAIGGGNRLEIMREIHFPHSLGLLYSAFTYYTGFRVNSGEYKLMGLAPYGKPVYAGAIRGSSDRGQAGWIIPAQPRIFQLLRRPDHDPRAVRRSVRRTSPPARSNC